MYQTNVAQSYYFMCYVCTSQLYTAVCYNSLFNYICIMIQIK